MKYLLFTLLLNTLLFSNLLRNENIVINTDLNIVWQDDVSVQDTKLYLEDAKQYCSNLSLNSYKNWRLPTYEELLSIGDYEVYKPTLNPIFKNSASGHFWSLTYQRISYGEGWVSLNDYYVKRLYFSDGYSYDNDRTGKAYVRCVSGL